MSTGILLFSPLGEAGDPYPEWLRELTNSDGVYLILEKGVLAYIGESHTGRLYGTATRHFQRWSDKYNTAGPTYRRKDCEMALVLVPAAHAFPLQNDLILELALRGQAPRDNRQLEAETDERPHDYDYDIRHVLGSLFAVASDVPF
jgi:hypothetical protein